MAVDIGSAARMHWLEWGGDVIHYIDLRTLERSTYLMPPGVVNPLFSRSITLPENKIFLCGGRFDTNGKGLKHNFIIHPDESFSWERNPDMIFGHSNHFAGYCSNYIYVIAGCDEANNFTDKCEKFSLTKRTWQTISRTHSIRDSINGIVDQETESLYVLGGRTDFKALCNTVERYSIAEDVWTELSIRIPHAVDMHGLVLIPNSQQVLLFAGYDKDQQSQKSSFLIDLASGEFEECGEMKTTGGCIVNEIRVYDGWVYSFIFQGYTTRKLERFHLETKTWENLSP